MSSTTESNKIWFWFPGLCGGTLLTPFPAVYSPVRTLQRYIILGPLSSALAFAAGREIEGSKTKYTPSPNDVSANVIS